jgi:prevent-host-death family protein
VNSAEVVRGRVLLVDDEASVRTSYGRWLTDAGFHVSEASGGHEALGLLEHHAFDVALTGMLTPALDGLTLLRRVQARIPDMAVVLMLDSPNNRVAIQAKTLGAVESLIKPLDAQQLEDMATWVVRWRRSEGHPMARFRNRRGDPLEPASYTATDAKNEFGRVLELVTQGGAVVITKHDAPKAVLISVEEFNALSHAREKRLDSLTNEFDALLAQMQTPHMRAAMKSAFQSSPHQLGASAVAAARKRG